MRLPSADRHWLRPRSYQKSGAISSPTFTSPDPASPLYSHQPSNGIYYVHSFDRSAGVVVVDTSTQDQKPESDQFPPWAEGHVFQQYRLIVEETARVSDRRHSTNNLFVSVNSVLLAAIAILVQQGTNKNIAALLFLAFLPLGAGFVLCVFWLILLRGYSRRINKRLAYLGELETKRYATYLLPVFSAQDTQVSFARAEAGIPIIFLVAYLAAAVGAIALESGWLASLAPLLPHALLPYAVVSCLPTLSPLSLSF
jgi:hypothetical protein